ncbi:MAG: peptidylprolyl isomerase [Myxococcota bacterium]
MFRRTSLALLGLVVSGCPKPAAVPDAGSTPKDVVAVVNGVPISSRELLLRTRSSARSGSPAEVQERALDELILDELFAQQAKAKGYEADPSFVEEMARLEAQVAEVRRRELAKAFLHRDILQKAAATEAEARAHFDAHQPRFTSDVRVAQVVLKDKLAADAAQEELAKGRSFDDVAAERVGAVAPGEKPWELPMMTWAQVPPTWWPALDALQPGQVSAPFRTPDGRWVVLKLLERKPVTPDFEALKPLIQAHLKSEAMDAARRATEAQLRAAARIELRGVPPAPPPPREP